MVPVEVPSIDSLQFNPWELDRNSAEKWMPPSCGGEKTLASDNDDALVFQPSGPGSCLQMCRSEVVGIPQQFVERVGGGPYLDSSG